MSATPRIADIPEPEGVRVPAVGYQGQPGSFGARAAARAGRPVAYPTFDKLLRALAAGETDAAVLPAVNRVAGPIHEPLEALVRAMDAGAALLVTGETSVPVRLVLAAPAGVALAEVREVHSQPPALRQCRKLLASLDATAIETHDTAYAAVRIAETGGPRAAVCSEDAALAAGLVVLLEDVSDIRPNATRFWVLERTGDAGEPEGLPEGRVVRYATPAAAAVLAEAGAELLSLPGIPEEPVRGFAILAEAQVAPAAARLTGRAKVLWLGPPPEVPRPPRITGLPRATEVRPAATVAVGGFVVGAGRRALIAGPCAVESEEQVHRLARAAARAGATALRGGVFKPRTSPYAFQGHGLPALEWMKAAGDAVGLPIVTEVMAPAQVERVALLADVLQIGARNCQNYDLLKEAGASGRPVLLKRGFGTTVEEWLSSAEYLLEAGCADVMLCERGIRTFEKATRGTLDLGGMLAARLLTHLPILADPSHAAGRKDLVAGLARAAWHAGADGLMIEIHDTPEIAQCDGPQALLPEDLETLCDELGLLPGEGNGSVERIRGAIDAVDAELGRLVTRRRALARQVAQVKRATGRPLRDPGRETAVMSRLVEAMGGHEEQARCLAQALIALSLTEEGWAETG